MESLAIALLWNSDDAEEVQEYVGYIENMLLQDLTMPFSRTINLPIFVFTNRDKEIPEIKLLAEKVMVYAFIGTNSVVSELWRNYIDKLCDNKKYKIIPIALDKYAFNISTKLENTNFIRLFEFMECKKQQLFINVAHEIYRYGFNDNKEIMSEKYALKIFLSHAKIGEKGLDLAIKLKNLIDDTSMKRFFDSNNIAPGYEFNEEIINNIKESSVIIINTDVYSSRYWCQREIQTAKEYERPMIEVDYIEKGIDRKFPYASNVPVVRVNTRNKSVRKEELYSILECIIVETIRFNYARVKLEKVCRKYNEKVKIMCRPPEMIDLSKIIINEEGLKVEYERILYPDPPIYTEEIDFFEKIGLKVSTPTKSIENSFFGKKVGISISKPSDDSMREIGQDERHLQRLSQAIAKYVLGSGATLIYGGDLRDNGYTQQLLEEAEILKNRLGIDEVRLKNYLSWPIYLQEIDKNKSWQAQYRKLLQMIEVEADEKVKEIIGSTNRFVVPDTVEHKYVWSKSLTKMRKTMIFDCDARICAGGACYGYKGCMPGVLEEILIAQQNNCPLYLLGGFGGIVHEVCELIQRGVIGEALTEKGQESNNKDYDKILSMYQKEGTPIKYSDIQGKLIKMNLNNGLSSEENQILFNTMYVDEAVALILKGLQNIKED